MLLPAPSLPDETIYSRLVRHQLASGYNISQFLVCLFGKRKVRFHPYLPRHINQLTIAGFGSQKKIIYEQTLYPLFAFFEPEQATKLWLSMLSSNGTSPTTSALLSQTKGKCVLSLKECPFCIREDIETYGVSYWHLTHQVPGISACAKHSTDVVNDFMTTQLSNIS